MGDAEERTPDFVWTAPEDVAEQAVGGAERGKRVVVPGGVLNQATALGGPALAADAAAAAGAERIWRRAGGSRC